MTTAYLTPKPNGDGHALPACPPPPEAAHETIDVPAPSLPPRLDIDGFDVDGALSPCGAEGFILVAPGVPQRSGAKFLPPARRSRGAVASPFLKPRPRPSRNVEIRNAETSIPDAETSAFSLTPSLTSAFSPTPSFYSLKPKISKRPSFSRAE